MIRRVWAGLGLILSAAGAGPLPALDDAAARARLPKAEAAPAGPLPAWARVLAGPLPRTTAAMLELDDLHRSASPLPPKLRAAFRFTVAHANTCEYGKAYALADLRRAGGSDAEAAALAAGDWPGDDGPAVAFVRKLTREADTVTDDEVAALRKRYGDASVVAMVLLVAHGAFQDRLILMLGVGVEPGGPLPPGGWRFARGGPAPTVPERHPPAGAAAAEPPRVADPDWAARDLGVLRRSMETQKAREGRVPVPSWEAVVAGLPPGYPVPPKPIRIRWSLVCLGYQPRLAAGWSACTRAFMEEAKQDRVFEESLFWVVTRSLNCFY
jgi:alkylhydroperoxidase family enzyme